jgi:hypothetical protein
LVKRKGPRRTAAPTEVTGRAEPFPTTMEEGREGLGEWKIGCLRPGWCGRRHQSQPPSQRPRWVGPASSWKRSWQETGSPTHWSRAPTQAETEAPGVGEVPAEAGEEPRAQPAGKRRRRLGERWQGEGPQHPRMARATCRWCQSTGCRGRATESHLESCSGRPTGRRGHSCDRGHDPPGDSRMARSFRGRWGRSGVERNPLGVRWGSLRRDVERRGGCGGRSGGEAKLLEKEVVLHLCNVGKQLHAGEDGRQTIEARAQTT